MQGFNMGRYRPYDSDPRKESFNGRTQTRVLGKRERKRYGSSERDNDTQGSSGSGSGSNRSMLVVRFELPFNVWCDACQAHIGQGVRYNAEKRRMGAYYSTPIFAFRCKKTCCQTWMEIQTDPKNARYVINSGAREQNKEWNPEENGGHPIYHGGDDRIHSTGADAHQPDAFDKLEKDIVAKDRERQRTERLDQLKEVYTARCADPYTLNCNLRNTFRADKKQRLQIQAKDDELRKRIGWHNEIHLAPTTPSSSTANCSSYTQLDVEKDQRWVQERDKAAGVGKSHIATPFRAHHSRTRTSKQSKPSAASALAARLIANTRKKTDPFRIEKTD